jgi:hypothetical protein
MNAITIITPGDTADIHLSDIMRSEKIVGIHWDPLLDRFTVHLRDYSCGGGASVGEALDKAKLPGAENVRRIAA